MSPQFNRIPHRYEIFVFPLFVRTVSPHAARRFFFSTRLKGTDAEIKKKKRPYIIFYFSLVLVFFYF